MIQLHFQTRVTQSFLIVRENFGEKLFEALRPVFPIIRILAYEGQHPGAKVWVQMKFGLFTWDWISRISSVSEDEKTFQFIDIGEVLPPFLGKWRHVHSLVQDKTGTIIHDDLEFAPGKFWPEWLVRILIWSTFVQRGPGYRKFFSSLKIMN
jgi:ligand-binding SRPBCC domain-containing protein